MKVNGLEDPFVDPPGPSWSYLFPAPQSSMKLNIREEKVAKKKKHLSTLEMREEIAANDVERMRCVRKFL